jgi:hypothetical protein
VLHEAKLVEVRKGFENRRPQTLCCLTVLGRRRFLDYLSELERVIHDAIPSHVEAGEAARPSVADMPLGWGPA